MFFFNVYIDNNILVQLQLRLHVYTIVELVFKYDNGLLNEHNLTITILILK